MATECRSCRAPVLWVTTVPALKAMPIDPLPDPKGNLVLYTDGDKSFVTVFKPNVHGPDQKRYRSHFASCVNAAAHRRPKEKRA